MFAGLGLTVVFLAVGSLKGQDICWKDTVKIIHLQDPCVPGANRLQWRWSKELDYALSCSDFLEVNRRNMKNAHQMTLLQNIKLQTILERPEGFRIRNSFFHTLGVQFFFDSISKFQFDENVLDTRFDLKIVNNFSATLSSLVTTRIFDDYFYSINDSGKQVRFLQSGFLTPLVWTFSLGFCWNWKGVLDMNFGLSSARLTYVRDKRVFSSTGQVSFFGVPKDKSALFEYGIFLRLLVDKSFREKVLWKCEIQLFKNFNTPFDFFIKNSIDIRITKYFKTSIQTRMFYEETQSQHLQLENLISFGFNFHL